jgi:hypothetical protein
VAGCCECCDEPLGSCATELVSYNIKKGNCINTNKRSMVCIGVVIVVGSLNVIILILK